MAGLMESKINKFLEEVKKAGRLRFSLSDLEAYLSKTYKSESKYQEDGGYIGLVDGFNLLVKNNKIRSIKSSAYNGLNPPLKLKWEILREDNDLKWDKSKLLRMSDLLDFSYYTRNPSFQTDKEMEYIENIYNFLKERERRHWVSVEDRSLELFYDEKFLTERKESLKGKYGILKRLKLSHEDLKMKKYAEMFIYWNRGTNHIKNIIILENHSSFFSYKRIAELGNHIFGVFPDVLIYGEGNKIENSFTFIEEIGDISNVKVFYFGDIDSEGLGIYYRLKNRYEDFDISLQKQAYTNLIDICIRDYHRKSDRSNPEYLEFFIEEMGDSLPINLKEKLLNIWNENLRIPQELINYEYLLRVIK